MSRPHAVFVQRPAGAQPDGGCHFHSRGTSIVNRTIRLLRRAGFSLHELSCAVGCPSQFLKRPLRANIAETILLVGLSEQGEKKD